MTTHDTVSTNQGLFLSSFTAPAEVVERPIPRATSGTAVVRVLATLIFPYVKKVHHGQIPQLNLPIPCIPHPTCVGRVHELPSDAALLKPGDLIWADGVIKARDDPTVFGLQAHLGGHNARTEKFMRGEWHDGTLQQYVKIPLETCMLLDENRLIHQLGYTPAELTTLALYETAAGAVLDAANIRPGETIVIGPATGSFGGATVHLALAAGANVIAVGRNITTLDAMKKSLGNPERLQLLAMTGNNADDIAATRRLTPRGQGADIFNDWTPGWIQNPVYLEVGVRSLKPGGRVVLSGSALGNVEIEYNILLQSNISIIGRLVTTRQYTEQIINMIAIGAIQIGRRSGAKVKEFGLLEHEEAFDYAEENGGMANYTVVMPNGVDQK